MDDFFRTSFQDACLTATAIAREIEATGEMGEAAAKAMEAGIADMKEIAASAPFAYRPSLFERIGDWFYDLKDRLTGRAPLDDDEDDDPLLAALQLFRIILLRSHPMEKLPISYDEAEDLLDFAAGGLTPAICEHTGWQPLAITPYTPQEDDWAPDPRDVVRRAFTLPGDVPHLLLLATGAEDDPKIMGYSLGLLHLSGDQAVEMIARLTKP